MEDQSGADWWGESDRAPEPVGDDDGYGIRRLKAVWSSLTRNDAKSGRDVDDVVVIDVRRFEPDAIELASTEPG